MELIDTLPAYVYKPFKFNYKPRNTVEDSTKDAPVAQDPTTVETKKTKTIHTDAATAKYDALKPLIESLDKNDTISAEGKIALLGQFVNESGWKSSAERHGYNYGNITAGSSWDGKIMQRGDHDAEGNPIVQNFRVYGSADEFVDDYLNLLKTSYPDAYKALSADEFDINTFTDSLTTGKRKYAVDPVYKQKVTQLFNTISKDLLTNK